MLVAAPASAHTFAVSGTTSCPGMDHLVTWTISNVTKAADGPMTITSASAEINGTTYTVSGYASAIDGGEHTTATTTVPGDVTGTITITVHGRWGDGFKRTETGTVDLVNPCVETTTTTSTTSTTLPPTTTAVGGTTTTTGGPGVSEASTSTSTGGVSDIQGGTTTTTVASSGSGSLPFTGSGSATGMVVGALSLFFGVVLLVGAKRSGAFLRR